MQYRRDRTQDSSVDRARAMARSSTDTVRGGSDGAAKLTSLVRRAVAKRRDALSQRPGGAARVVSGEGDGLPGVFIDVFGGGDAGQGVDGGDRGGGACGAVMNVYEGVAPVWLDGERVAGEVLEALRAELAPARRVRGLYVKPFAKDRSRLGGQLPEIATRAKPSAGDPLPEAIVMREHGWNLEVRLFDGLSTGIFLDQRENRAMVHAWARAACAQRGMATPVSVLNTFAYTCGFSVAAAVGGAITTSVDVSARYLDWGKRNFVLNGLDPARHRFARMDTFEFFDYAQRKGLRYDMIILDPPSFATGNKRKGVRAWSSVDDYAMLVQRASRLLSPRGAPSVGGTHGSKHARGSVSHRGRGGRGGEESIQAAIGAATILASTNTQELCQRLPQGGTRLQREVCKGMGHVPGWLELPAMPSDFAGDRGRFAACWFVP